MSGDELETAAGVFYVAPAQKYEYTAAVASREVRILGLYHHFTRSLLPLY